MNGDFKGRRVVKKDGLTFVYLNNLILQIDSQGGLQIISNELSEETKQNILKSYKNDLNDFIKLLETNLDCFIEEEDKNITRKLGKSFKFPTNNLENPNLAIALTKSNILILMCVSPNLQVECKKCKASRSVEGSGECLCKALLKTNFIPVMDYEYLGSCFPDNCAIACMNPSNFQITCEGCGTSYETPKVGINERFSMNCWECGILLSFTIKKITYFSKNTYNFKKGEQLPDKGTCKHYKKSYRWFRFPCCGSVYPCDICHDIETNHEHSLANKMICGLCSKEQSVNKDCECGMSLKKSTSCWEGGKGNRNKQTMNKKDKKKYTK